MTKAYWIVRVTEHDQARYPEYLALARPAFERFGARFVVGGGSFEAMEGLAGNVMSLSSSPIKRLPSLATQARSTSAPKPFDKYAPMLISSSPMVQRHLLEVSGRTETSHRLQGHCRVSHTAGKSLNATLGFSG